MCNDDDIAAEVEKITGGKGAYGAIDCVAGDLTGQMLAAVRPGGQILLYGAMASFSTTLNVGDLLFKQKVGTWPWSCYCILCTGLRGLMTVMGRICCLCKGSVQLADVSARVGHLLQVTNVKLAYTVGGCSGGQRLWTGFMGPKPR